MASRCRVKSSSQRSQLQEPVTPDRQFEAQCRSFAGGSVPLKSRATLLASCPYISEIDIDNLSQITKNSLSILTFGATLIRLRGILLVISELFGFFGTPMTVLYFNILTFRLLIWVITKPDLAVAAIVI